MLPREMEKFMLDTLVASIAGCKRLSGVCARPCEASEDSQCVLPSCNPSASLAGIFRDSEERGHNSVNTTHCRSRLGSWSLEAVQWSLSYNAARDHVAPGRIGLCATRVIVPKSCQRQPAPWCCFNDVLWIPQFSREEGKQSLLKPWAPAENVFSTPTVCRIWDGMRFWFYCKSLTMWPEWVLKSGCDMIRGHVYNRNISWWPESNAHTVYLSAGAWRPILIYGQKLHWELQQISGWKKARPRVCFHGNLLAEQPARREATVVFGDSQHLAFSVSVSNKLSITTPS